MSLADDVQEATRQQHTRKPCGTGVWLANVDERDSRAFTEFLADGGTVSRLHQIAVKNGCPIAETQFRRHCRKRCSCYDVTEMAA